MLLLRAWIQDCVRHQQTWLLRASEARFTEGLEVSFSILITTWVREIIRTTTYCQIKQLPITNWTITAKYNESNIVKESHRLLLLCLVGHQGTCVPLHPRHLRTVSSITFLVQFSSHFTEWNMIN